MTFCQRGKELLLDLNRSDFIPEYDDDGLRVVISEIQELSDIIVTLRNENNNKNNNNQDENDNEIVIDEEFQLPILYHKLCMQRNMKYLYCYINYRLSKISSLRWETGTVLPDRVRHDTLSVAENHYFGEYNKILTEYNAHIGFDMTADLEPPKELLIELRVLQSCGEIMTENGPVKLDQGSTHFLRRSNVEHLIRIGKLEHVL